MEEAIIILLIAMVPMLVMSILIALEHYSYRIKLAVLIWFVVNVLLIFVFIIVSGVNSDFERTLAGFYSIFVVVSGLMFAITRFKSRDYDNNDDNIDIGPP